MTVAISILDKLKFDYAREKFAIMESKLSIRIFPYLHQPRINFSRMITDPYSFILYKVHLDHVYALSRDFNLYKWCIITGQLVSRTS